ncbi:alkaline serine protease [Pyrococcus furiosus DSM 3638]|uniref:Subtilisin-like serine protease n=3 Tax=Pyrococcus furiosus TaxID=2261 RepID=A0A5C0XRC7_PYRFU|nr:MULTISPECIES: S8 family serine peptidase [Pyrococcus]AAL81794.1 alkaline serine protease [Pyrococcus furiosus DSM 3638]AFN04970.1 alkaline serine protease [Pyrococcus furiosus COM1]MDK2870569.1 serine protease AprX [Pyrococcus sp.]QEK79291.1 alkaline serine protease [Pyrococcus furiosus DSM 3638]
MKGLKALILVILVLGLVVGSVAAAPEKKVEQVRNVEKNYGLLTPGLFRKIQKLNPNEEISTVIVFENHREKEIAVRVLELMGAKVRYVYHIIPAIAADLKVRDLLVISGLTGGKAKLSGVRFIQEDYKVTVSAELEGLDESAAQVMATYVWNLGYDGSGITIGIIDTGIDASHPDLQGKVIGWVDFVNGRSYPYDDHGHGTHVASIAAGTGAASNGKYKGMAPGAKLAGIKVLGADGSGSISTIIKGVEWAVDNKDKYGIKVINLSLGSSQSSDGTDALSQAVNAAWDAGLVVVVAAGNSGPNKYTIGSPAAASKVITVGAVDKYDVITSFSSRGPTADGRLKPEVVAPGNWIIAARASGTSMGQPINDYYTAAPGTSMATPHVAGIAALLLQAHPSWTPDKVKTALIETADIVKPDEIADIAYGAGRVNAYKAINYDNYAKLVFTGYVANKGSQTHQFVISGASFVTATLYWDNANSDLDLYLYDPNGNQVDYSYTAYYGFEKVGYYNPTDGTWTIKVVSYSGSANYQVDVVSDGSLSQPGSSPSPQPEPTVDAKTFQGSVHYYYDRSDTFTMTVNSGATKITGDLVFDTSYHDLDLYLYDPNQKLVDRSESSNSYEHVEYLNPAPGTWYFLVYAYYTYGWAYYELTAKVYYG